MNGSRFTAWFNSTERAALETEARRQQTTLNYIVRKAVRKYLGPEKLKQAAEEVTHVTGNK